MRSSAERGIHMLDQLSDLARARLGGGLPIERRETDFRDARRQGARRPSARPSERPLTVEYDAGPTAGVWDEGRLGQALAQLVRSGLRHGTGDKGVSVRVHGASPKLVVEVHNDGEIPAALRPHLFDPFSGDSQQARDGLNLGLYIVQQIVLAHGGAIELTSSRETARLSTSSCRGSCPLRIDDRARVRRRRISHHRRTSQPRDDQPRMRLRLRNARERER